jgi:hypothetical protein
MSFIIVKESYKKEQFFVKLTLIKGTKRVLSKFLIKKSSKKI